MSYYDDQEEAWFANDCKGSPSDYDPYDSGSWPSQESKARPVKKKQISRSSNLLKRGDVFILPKGTKVYHRTKDFQGVEVCVGEPTYIEGFQREERVIDGKKWFTEQKLVKVKNFVPAPGEYRVTRTAFDGGGPDGYRGSYPNGHHVWARPVGDRDKAHEIHFYQTGCFTCMVEDPKRVAASGNAH